MAKNKKVVRLVPLTSPFWRYDHPDGVITIYSPKRKFITVERANFLLDMAKRDLMNRT